MSSIIKFTSPAGSKDIVYIFLDRTSQCRSGWTKELMKNLSDYVLSNIVSKGFDVWQGLDEDELLREASKYYTHAVVLSTGTEFINGDEFFNEVELEVYGTKDFFLIGHIPDRDDGYYELHEQCYIINLETYKELGCPFVGKFAYYSAHTQIEPRRSEENIHDDYTPLWIVSGDKERTYKHKWHGWNIISVGLANNKFVKVIMKRFRDNKKYYYPNYEPAFIPASAYLYGKQQFAAQTLFYPYNTEQFQPIEFEGPVRQLVIQASGLQFIDYLIVHGYDENTVVRFVDYNLLALECMNHITTCWDGNVDYMEFVKDYIASRSDFLSSGGDNWITTTGHKQEVFPAIWMDIINTVKFEFHHEDLVLNTGLAVTTWADNVPNTIIHLSHIFDYDPVATFYPLKHRIYSRRLLLEKIKSSIPDAHIIILDEIGGAKRPTWHMNGEFDEI
jgi:hypothetical protein